MRVPLIVPVASLGLSIIPQYSQKCWSVVCPRFSWFCIGQVFLYVAGGLVNRLYPIVYLCYFCLGQGYVYGRFGGLGYVFQYIFLGNMCGSRSNAFICYYPLMWVLVIPWCDSSGTVRQCFFCVRLRLFAELWRFEVPTCLLSYELFLFRFFAWACSLYHVRRSAMATFMTFLCGLVGRTIPAMSYGLFLGNFLCLPFLFFNVLVKVAI